MMQVQSHDVAKLRVRYIFLFDKLILMSKSMRGEENFKLKELLKVSDYKVQDVLNENSSSNTGDVIRAAGRRVIMRRDSSRWTHAFLLVHTKNMNAFTLYSRTAEEKKVRSKTNLKIVCRKIKLFAITEMDGGLHRRECQCAFGRKP